MKITMNNSKDEKSKYNKESILSIWKTLKQYIEPEAFARELVRCNFLATSILENLGSKSRSHQATLVLIPVYRKIQSSEQNYQEFFGILRRHNSAAAEALINLVGGPINNTGSVDQDIIEQQSNLLKRFEKKLKNKLKKNLQVVLGIIDNLIECGILDIDEVEQILHSPKEAHELLVEFINRNIHLGAYYPLVQALKSETKFEDVVSDLTTAVVSEDIKTAKHILQEKRNQFPVGTRENTYRFELSIHGMPENRELNRELLDRYSPAEVALFKHTGATIENKKEGSATFRFGYFYPNNVIAVKGKIQQGVMSDIMSDIMKNMDSSVLDRVSKLDVTLRCSNNKTSNTSTTIQLLSALLPDLSPLLQTLPEQPAIEAAQHQTEAAQHQTEAAQHLTELVQHTMNVTIIAANRSFLIEEINTMALVRAFQDKGITCFDGLDGTLERQQRAADFLTILERNKLLDQLLYILREQRMTYVLGRLISCRNAYSADPQILKRNISSNRINILDNLDIYDVRELFIEREVFSSRMFDEIEEKYSESEDQMSAVLIAITQSGPRAMQILVDALYMNQADSLADSLLRGTPNELQEMLDNTETDESSSDGDFLYKGTFVVSKADEKP